MTSPHANLDLWVKDGSMYVFWMPHTRALVYGLEPLLGKYQAYMRLDGNDRGATGRRFSPADVGTIPVQRILS